MREGEGGAEDSRQKALCSEAQILERRCSHGPRSSGRLADVSPSSSP